MNKQSQKRLTPLAQLFIQHWINQEHIRLPRLVLLSIRRHELADKLNHADTAPRTTIHRRHRRQLVTHHKELAHDDKLLLVPVERPRLHHVLTRELLHPRRVDRLLVIRLLHVDEPLRLGRHDIRIRRTRFRALPCEHGGLHRGLIVAKGHSHQLDQLGLSVTTHTRRHIEALLAVHALQARCEKPQCVAAQLRIREEFSEEVHNICL